MKKQIWVSWKTRNPETIRRVRERFNIPQYTTVNGFSPAEIEPEDMPLLEETANRGFISIIHEKWCKNGDVFAFINRK